MQCIWPPSLCRAIFDVDNIDIRPERRAYLETKLERVWDINSEESIPWCVWGVCVGNCSKMYVCVHVSLCVYSKLSCGPVVACTHGIGAETAGASGEK